MVRLELNWYERINLWLRVGSVQAPNMQIAAALYRVIEKIRPSDTERGEANLITRQDGSVSWTLPNADLTYGTRFVNLEDEEAKHLVETIESPQQVMSWMVNDMIWVLPLVDKLKGRAGQTPAPMPVQDLVSAQ